jgi:hypothetical protein
VGHFCPPGSGSTDLIESGSVTLIFEKDEASHAYPVCEGRGGRGGGARGAVPLGGPASSKRPKKPVVGRGRPAPTGPMPVAEGEAFILK